MVIKSIEKFAGKPTINCADIKNVTPLTNVPIGKVNNTKILLWSLFVILMKSHILFIKIITKNIIFAVTSLSIIFGNCPPGNFVVKAVNIPVIIAEIRVIL